MALALDTSNFPAPAKRVLDPAAPAPMRAMAAKGVIPGLRPGDIVCVVALLGEDGDEAVASAARATLAKLPPPILNGALDSDLPGPVLELLSHHYATQHDVIERLLRKSEITAAALEELAGRADERAGELIATNEELMLKHPSVIEKLYMNKNVRMSTADRLLELAVRNGLELSIPAFKEAAAAIRDELIPEPTEEPTLDDVLFHETDQIAAKLDIADNEDTHEVDDEGAERVKEKVLPLYMQVGKMTVTQKIRRAMLGTAADRSLLVRDTNRLVAAAAAKSPRMTDSEAVLITASRAVSDEVLRIIAMNRDFVRHYQVKLNLVMNPRTPFTFSSRLVPHLRDADLRSLAKSKNITGSVAQAIRQQVARKDEKKG
jgi:hypothetical protein